MSDEFDGYVTQYALTAGIQPMRLRPTNASRDMVQPVPAQWGVFYHGEGKNWHRTYESARKRAEEMRKVKIASLRKSLAKLEALTFPEKVP